MRASSASSARQRPVGFSPVEISSLINTAVIEEHASEAAFCTDNVGVPRAPRITS